jgi:hypothetical protein
MSSVWLAAAASGKASRTTIRASRRWRGIDAVLSELGAAADAERPTEGEYRHGRSSM